MSAQTVSLSFSTVNDGFEWHSLLLSNLSSSLCYISVEHSAAFGYGLEAHCPLPNPHPYADIIPEEFAKSFGEVVHI